MNYHKELKDWLNGKGCTKNVPYERSHNDPKMIKFKTIWESIKKQ